MSDRDTRLGRVKSRLTASHEQDSKPSVVPGLIAFLSEKPRSDKEVHEWATSNGVTPEAAEEGLYRLMFSVFKGVGKHNGVPDTEFDAKELARGIEVEQEHTDDPDVAKMIAKDHLVECPFYYSGLDEMEKKCSTWVAEKRKNMQENKQ